MARRYNLDMTADQARSIWDYDPETGVFTWKPRKLDSGRRVKAWNSRCAGKPAGQTRKDGYLVLNYYGRKYYGHRVAWLIVHGRWPDCLIDHIDADPSNNRIANLREASNTDNLAASARMGHRRVDPSMPAGVFIRKRMNDVAYCAKVRHRNKQIYLGTYATQEEAHKAYLEACARIKGEFNPYA